MSCHAAVSSVLALLALVLQAGRGEDSSAPDIELKLLQPGAEPRRPLRYQIRAGSRESMLVAMKMRMEMQIGPVKYPPFQAPTTEMTMLADIKDALGGKVAYTFKLTEAKLLDDASLPAAARTAMREALNGTVGLGGAGSVTDRGMPISAKADVPAAAPPAVRDTLEGLKRSLRSLGTPLPEEPVGLGAKWQVSSRIEAGGMKVEQISIFEIKELLPDGFLATVKTEQIAEKQEMKPPGLPPGTTVHVETYKGSGDGTMKVDLHHLTPESTAEIRNSLDAVIFASGETQLMTTSTTISMSIRPKD